VGSGKWTTSTYNAVTTSKIAAGDTFAYSRSTASRPQAQWKAHETLDPKGLDVRESRDSTEHPTSLAIAVMFDVTGSMHTIPAELQAQLPKLMDGLQQRHNITDPQILFGGVGDATCDRVPLQIGQFESDNRADDSLDNLFLEGGGGGSKHESYELALYFAARHTSIDCFEQRGEKGYLFVIGDELPYDECDALRLNAVFGGQHSTVSFEDILAEAQETFEVFYVLPTWAAHGRDQDVISFWRKHLGDHFITYDQNEDIVDVIGLGIETVESIKVLKNTLNP
jgi:hypothetical protein